MRCVQSRDDPVDHVGNSRRQPLYRRVGISTETFSHERGRGNDASYVMTQSRHKSFELSGSLLWRLIHPMLPQSSDRPDITVAITINRD